MGLWLGHQPFHCSRSFKTDFHKGIEPLAVAKQSWHCNWRNSCFVPGTRCGGSCHSNLDDSCCADNYHNLCCCSIWASYESGNSTIIRKGKGAWHKMAFGLHLCKQHSCYLDICIACQYPALGKPCAK